MVDREELESICKRRGFMWPSSEIYGGEAGFYDYGHLGARLKDGWEKLWKDYFLGLNDNYHMIYTPNILPYRALKASGHVDQFSDVLVNCMRCNTSYRADHLVLELTGENIEGMDADSVESIFSLNDFKCPSCNGSFSKAEDFNMMFSINIGPTGEHKGFLRPETAQGTYMNFYREYRTLRRQMPIGLATIGGAFRNEISPRQGVYRMREFLQAELQIFFIPGVDEKLFEEQYQPQEEINVILQDSMESNVISVDELDHIPIFYRYHLAKVYKFYLDQMKLDVKDVRLRELSRDERAFYNRIHFDVEVNLSSLGGWKEVAGIHYRGDYDLNNHQDASGTKMSIPVDGERIVPHVLELSFGVDRNVWALLDRGYRSDDRDWLDLPSSCSPYHAAIFPLVRKDGLVEKSLDVYDGIKGSLRVFWDKSGSVGKRYARMDEIGTPFCITVDYDTLRDDSVTLRHIKTKEQIRVNLSELEECVELLISEKKDFSEINS